MTKLAQWVLYIGLAFGVWISLLYDILPCCCSHTKEMLWPMPVYAIIVFGCYSLATVGYRVATFNDCVEASQSLKKEIEDARRDLTSRGFKFE